MQPGDSVFDFGSGCGHKMMWLSQLFGVRTYGVDIVQGAANFANQYASPNANFFSEIGGPILQPQDSSATSSISSSNDQENKKVCHVGYDDSLTLGFIPDNSFDFAISCSVIQLLPPQAQCRWFKSVL